MNDQIRPEELTELLDDDLEMWAQGGTRIMTPRRHDAGPKPDSFPPVAYPSMPPSSAAPPAMTGASHAPIWAALGGMASVFFLAAIGGGIFYALRANASTSVATAEPVRYGAIQTFAAGAGKPVFLDGKQIGTGGARIKAACGKHSVAVGAGRARTVDIPCSGTEITVGTPDGT